MEEDFARPQQMDDAVTSLSPDGSARASLKETSSGLYARGVSRSFGSVKAVAGIDLHAPAGEVTALVGPNGSGKTTLMLMLASLLRPDTGVIKIMGVDPSEDPRTARQSIGWMPDTLGISESLTVKEILSLMARFYDLPREIIPGRVRELLELVRLEEFTDQKARVLSRGQQQRLSLARALINDPDVLILDEPASGLDPGSRISLRQILRDLAAQGKAVLVSSHDLSELDEIADSAVFINSGRSVLAQSVQQAVADTRRYTIAATDRTMLTSVLTQLGVSPMPSANSRRGQLEVVVGSEADAVRLLGDLVKYGVPVSQFGPSAGALEEAYLKIESRNQL